MIDLANRPAWLIERNPPDGRVPVLEEEGWVLPESAVIDEYLEERYPGPCAPARSIRASGCGAPARLPLRRLRRRRTTRSGAARSGAEATAHEARRRGRAPRRDAVPHRPRVRARGRRVHPVAPAAARPAGRLARAVSRRSRLARRVRRAAVGRRRDRDGRLARSERRHARRARRAPRRARARARRPASGRVRRRRRRTVRPATRPHPRRAQRRRRGCCSTPPTRGRRALVGADRAPR